MKPEIVVAAEKSVLGAMIMDVEAIAGVASILSADDFALPSHRGLYDTVMGMFGQGQAIDVLSVDAKLRATKIEKPTAGDLCVMVEQALPSHVKAHAEIVQRASHTRRLGLLCQETLKQLSETDEDPRTIAAQLASKVLQVCESNRRGMVPIDRVVVRILRDIENAYENKTIVISILTGLSEIDSERKLGGLCRGQLIIIAGRPSMGKTALATTIAKGAAARGHVTAFISCESSMDSIVLRLFAAATGVENRALRKGKLEDSDFAKIANAAGRISCLPMIMMDREKSWDAIKVGIRSTKAKNPALSLVVIDYIGLIEVAEREDRWRQVGRISREAKTLALELDLALVLLSQLNREVEGRTDKKPQLSDLRESGDLEQDADVVGLLYRPAYYDHNFEPRELTEFNIAKNRDDTVGTLFLKFDERAVAFSDWTDPLPSKGSAK